MFEVFPQTTCCHGFAVCTACVAERCVTTPEAPSGSLLPPLQCFVDADVDMSLISSHYGKPNNTEASTRAMFGFGNLDLSRPTVLYM